MHVGESGLAPTIFNWDRMLSFMDLQRESEELMPANVALITFGPLKGSLCLGLILV